MAVGNAGSPLNAELNRLANGGTYPARTEFLAEQGAANKWAGTTGKALLAALNYKVDATRGPGSFKGLNAVCNELASTSGKEAVDALRSLSS